MRSTLEVRPGGLIAILAPPGFGRSTTIEFLRERLGGVTCLDDPAVLPRSRPLVYAAPEPFPGGHAATLELAPWGQDEQIEYMLATHPKDCASVLGRAQDGELLQGSPELWAAVLDSLAADPDLPDVRAALRECGHRFAMRAPVRMLEEAGRRVELLRQGLAVVALAGPVPYALIREVARSVDDTMVVYLDEAIDDIHPRAASLLHAAGRRVEARELGTYSGAHLPGIVWRGSVLAASRLSCCDLSDADLTEARLESADAVGANFRGACLVQADLRRLRAEGASFVGADLSGARCHRAYFTDADLRDARFHDADLDRADLRDAVLTGADFTGARLTFAKLSGRRLTDAVFDGADFHSARLQACRLDGMILPGARMDRALLHGASLTSASMPGATLVGARLDRVQAADVDWEGADLRGATMTQMNFHMGSSRSGRIDSPIACEGSRTGFYTDESGESDFKAPEEVRKANLRGADLRGAILTGTDFYLVDLRDAEYHPQQGDWFRRCGAIL